MAKEPIISFNSGELSPLIDCRSDIDKYGSWCRTLENMIPTVHGIATMRPGTGYIYDAYSSSAAGRLIPFIYSNSIAYVIKMGNLIFRYFYDGAAPSVTAGPLPALSISEEENNAITNTTFPGRKTFKDLPSDVQAQIEKHCSENNGAERDGSHSRQAMTERALHYQSMLGNRPGYVVAV